jgi:hypothetical protein
VIIPTALLKSLYHSVRSKWDIFTKVWFQGGFGFDALHVLTDVNSHRMGQIGL